MGTIVIALALSTALVPMERNIDFFRQRIRAAAYEKISSEISSADAEIGAAIRGKSVNTS